jgi:hypothetical protein
MATMFMPAAKGSARTPLGPKVFGFPSVTSYKTLNMKQKTQELAIKLQPYRTTVERKKNKV